MTDVMPAAVHDPLKLALASAVAGDFRVDRELGRGGMGVVYLAHDVKLDRAAALKVLPPASVDDPVIRERFLREARTAARLAHPNIVPVYRADEVDGMAFFAMAYVDGESLAERVRDRGPLPPAEAVRILREVAWALAYAHARGVVHRDVKPENILLERATGRALVTDFGIARRVDESTGGAALTHAGAVLGTLHYMSPEQVGGDALDGRSDLYALGVVAYAALSGRLPFGDLAGPAVLVAHATRVPAPLSAVAPSVPRSLAAVVDRCLAKRPDDRYATGEALADALSVALADAPSDVRSPAEFGGNTPAVLSERDAAALWKRAAQLQADALNRLETRDELLTRSSHNMAAGSTNATSAYALANVVAAAEEAGISRQYIALAIAELSGGDHGGSDVASAAAAAVGVSERQATLFLGTDERSLAVSLVVRGSPANTLRALGAVLQQAPYELRLRETVGAHPLDGGVIVFDLTGRIVGLSSAPSGSVNTYWMATRQQLEVRQFQVTLRSVPGDPNATQLTMTCDARPGVRRNVRASQWLSGGLGAVAGLTTAGVLAKGAAVMLSLGVLGPAAAVGAVAAGLTMAGYRRMYPGVLEKSRREMLGALEAVAAAVQSERVFGALPGPGRPQRIGAGDG